MAGAMDLLVIVSAALGVGAAGSSCSKAVSIMARPLCCTAQYVCFLLVLHKACSLCNAVWPTRRVAAEDRWIACGVHDAIQFGLRPDGELKVETTICSEIWASGRPVIAVLPSA
jgi:hypothetical protein